MPNGGPDCCGTCWFNRANGGKAGDLVNNPNIPSHCEIRNLDVPDPFYTYCANHPHHRPNRDPIPIGPIYTAAYAGPGLYGRTVWRLSPDTEEIRQHLLDLVRLPEGHAKGGLGAIFGPSAYTVALEQLIEWRDERVLAILDQMEEKADGVTARRNIQRTIRRVHRRLDL